MGDTQAFGVCAIYSQPVVLYSTLIHLRSVPERSEHHQTTRLRGVHDSRVIVTITIGLWGAQFFLSVGAGAALTTSADWFIA